MNGNILYIIERLGPGGTEKQLYELMRGLSRSGIIKPHLCTLRPSLSLLEKVNCPKIELNFQRLLSFDIVSQIRQLSVFCMQHDIHLVQTFFQDPTVIGAIIKQLKHVKLIVSFRDLGFWRNQVENIKMRLAYTQADGFIANSMAVKSHFASADKIAPEKIDVIYNGFNIGLSASESPIHIDHQQGPMIGIVGNFNRPVKRIGDFIEMAALVSQRCKKACFIIIGDGADSERLELQRRCAALGLKDIVQFAGRLDNPLEHVRRFAVGVSTSASEGFSNAIIEYMACGIPVVVTDTGGNREMVAQGINGFRESVGDVQALADSVIKLLENEPLRLRMAKQNITDVREKYSMEQMIRAHEEYYLKWL